MEMTSSQSFERAVEKERLVMTGSLRDEGGTPRWLAFFATEPERGVSGLRYSTEKAREERTLTELVPARIPNDARVPQRTIGARCEDRLAVVAVVPHEMGRRMVATALLEQARCSFGRVEEPLLFRDGISKIREKRSKERTLIELSPPDVIIIGWP